MSHLNRIFLIITGLVLLVHLIFAAIHSQAVTQITIQLVPGTQEYRDKHFLTLGKKEQLPDYEILVLETSRSKRTLGFKKDTSAENPLIFTIAEPIPLRDVQSIIVQDKDKLESDILDTATVRSTRFTSDRYIYTLTTERTFAACMQYFFKTPLGVALSTGIIVGLVLAVFLNAS